jgi:hypothetical protein
MKHFGSEAKLLLLMPAAVHAIGLVGAMLLPWFID